MKVHVIVILEQGIIDPDPMIFTKKADAEKVFRSYTKEHHLDPDEPWDDDHEIHWFQGLEIKGMSRSGIPDWQKKLTFTERMHLKEMQIDTLEKFKITRRHQEKDGRKGFPEPCYVCKSIDLKLKGKK